MSRPKIIILVALAVLGVLVVAYLWQPEPPVVPRPGAMKTTPAAPAAPPISSPPISPSAAAPLPSELAELVKHLRGRYGKNVANPYVQIQMLEKLMRHFQAKNPAGWRDELLAAIRAAFPERYAEIAARLTARIDYEEWLKENDARLRGLGERERKDAIWEARKRLFGDEAAEQIWASERKGQALTDALAAIDARPNANIADRLAQYKESIQEAHQENADTFLQNHRQEALNRFLALESVQKELSSLPPAERASALRDVRKGLGLDDAALKRWDDLDHERDRRWEAGMKYMAERAALAKQYSGEILEAHLHELRTRYFGAEAQTIADEEAAGFFRFDRPRKYGLN